MRTFNLHKQKPMKTTETTITPFPREIPFKLPYGTLNKGKVEISNIARGSSVGHIAYYVHPSDNGGKELREIVTLRQGEKYVHRYTGDTRRAMDMIFATMQEENNE